MIPPVTDKIWEQLVLQKESYQFHLLSVKIMMSRVYRSTEQDPSKENIQKCIDGVYDFFAKNEKISQKDLEEIFK
jgi:hypothetical protein